MRLWNSKLLIAVGILLLGVPLAEGYDVTVIRGATQPTDRIIVAFTLTYRPAREVALLVDAVAPGRVRIAVDEPANRLLVEGQDEDLHTIGKFLHDIDRPTSDSIAPPLELTFFFIKSAIAPIPRPLFTPLALRTLPELETTIIKDLTPLRGGTLQNALDFLRSANKDKQLNIYLGPGMDTAVAINFAPLSNLRAVTLRVALERLLESFGSDYNYAIDSDDVLHISQTKALVERGLQPQLGRQFVSGVYDIGGLAFPGSGDPVEWWRDNLPIVVGGPEAWAPTAAGNEPSVRVLNRSVMLVNQTPEIHSKIAALLNKIRDTQKDVSQPLPDFLAPAAEALAQNDFPNPQLLASLTVRTESEKTFDTQGTTTDRANVLQFSVHGSAAKLQSDSRARLDISADVKTPAFTVSQKGEKDPSRTIFSVQTSIMAEYGDYIVLAASPSDPDIGKAIALVIRVTEAKPLAKPKSLTSQPAP
jgi:hypothetical protein